MKILIKIEFYNQTLWLNGEKRVIRGVVLQYWNYNLKFIGFEQHAGLGPGRTCEI